MSIIQSQTQKLSQKLTVKQIQLFNIISLPTAELEQYIANEMALNPALEYDNEFEMDNDSSSSEIDLHENEATNDFDDEIISEGKLGEDYDFADYMDRDSLDDYKLQIDNSPLQEDKKDRVIVGGINSTENLIEQVNLLSLDSKQQKIAQYIISSLDDDGYLRASLIDLADELSFKHSLLVDEIEIENVLLKIQTIEPKGIGARDLKECLLIQLNHSLNKTKDTYNAISILKNHINDLADNNLQNIKSSLKICQEDLNDAIAEIKSLNPKPLGSNNDNSDNSTLPIIPDFIVTVTNNEVELFLTQNNQPALKISEDYKEMLTEYSKSKNKELKVASQFIQDKIDNAKWFIDALQQRESMMVLITKAIVKHQKNYFITGDKKELKPMILKDVANHINSDISTVSRIANNKYISTPFGTLLIKDLFVQGIMNIKGEIIATNELKEEIKHCIDTENKTNPLSDDEIVKLLNQKQYSISRRTVAKYRDELNIPNKTIRKAA